MLLVGIPRIVFEHVGCGLTARVEFQRLPLLALCLGRVSGFLCAPEGCWGISELSAQSSTWPLGQLPLSLVVFLIHTMWMERLEGLGSHPFLLHLSVFPSQNSQQGSQNLGLGRLTGITFVLQITSLQRM